jgi:hypothetical protein
MQTNVHNRRYQIASNRRYQICSSGENQYVYEFYYQFQLRT